jgi:hypothetical protein
LFDDKHIGYGKVSCSLPDDEIDILWDMIEPYIDVRAGTSVSLSKPLKVEVESLAKVGESGKARFAKINRIIGFEG